MKTSSKARERNRAHRSFLRAAIRDLRAETSKDEALKKLRKVTSLLDKAVTTGIIHKRNADRSKSRLAHFVKNVG